jgi:PAP2 superfamily protein
MRLSSPVSRARYLAPVSTDSGRAPTRWEGPDEEQAAPPRRAQDGGSHSSAPLRRRAEAGTAPRSSIHPAEPRVRRRAQLLTVAGLTVFIAATVALVWTQGLILSRDWLFGWLLLGLLAVSLSDPLRWARSVVVDWLPLMIVLLCYDLSLPVRQWLGIQPHVWPQLDADRLVFGGIPTISLQHWLYDARAPHWYDYATFPVYLSHFFVTLLVLGLLWKFSHERFRHYRTLVVALATAGFVTYVLFPAVPPWLAAVRGYIEPVHRVIAGMWGAAGVEPAKALFENQNDFFNQEAAIPSLHAAYPMLLLLFFWGAGRWARAGLVTYVLAMAFTLVYAGEHYVADILIGWLYAAAVVAGVAWARRRRAARPHPADGAPRPQRGRRGARAAR